MPSILEALREMEDSTIVADALSHYADALRAGGDFLTRSDRRKANALFQRARRAENLATYINQNQPGGQQ